MDQIIRTVLVDAVTCVPDNEDARRIQKLIGKKLTCVQISEMGFVLTFDPYGEIRLSYASQVTCSLCAPEKLQEILKRTM